MTPERYAHVKEIFVQVFELAPEHRSAILHDLCGNDNELRQEVESLLEHHDDGAPLPEPPLSSFPADKPSLRIAQHSAIREEPFQTGRVFSKIFGKTHYRQITVGLLILFFTALGFLAYHAIKDSLNDMLSEQLQTLLRANVLALEIWIEERKTEAVQWANDPEIREQVQQLVNIAQTRPSAAQELRESPARQTLYTLLQPYLAQEEDAFAAVIDTTGVVLAAQQDSNQIGVRVSKTAFAYLSDIFDGKAIFSPPFQTTHPKNIPSWNATVPMYTFASAPVLNSQGQIMASLTLGENALRDFSEILRIAWMGKSGETYAMNAGGVMISESRFTEELKQIGLIENTPQAHSLLTMPIRDPGGDLSAGHKAALELHARPLTALAALAIASRMKDDPQQQQGVLITPYRNYRGVKVVGAWKWISNYDFGVVTEVTTKEAYAPLLYLELVFAGLFALLVIVAGLTLSSSFSVVRLRQKIGSLRQIGQYTLVKQIGEGGLANVYLARHAFLKRPTAIKILKPEQISEETQVRFEREVQFASQLTHPNTIEIYDFGRSAEGMLYYVMEYLEGLNLAELVSANGGNLPPNRVLHILQQVCESLTEAHHLGFIHRDIKPHNIMLCRRGGHYDTVKVLDFGLVKDIEQPEINALTKPARISGTLLYMAPERINDPSHVDARADIYALGAVGYYLLTGQHLFDSASDLDVLYHIIHEAPRPVAELIHAPIPPELNALIVGCLAKSPEDRPQNVETILAILRSIPNVEPWTQPDARVWWEKRAESLKE